MTRKTCYTIVFVFSVVSYVIACPVLAQSLYWTQLTPPSVQVGDFTGAGSPAILFDEATDGLQSNIGIAVDSANAKVYFSEFVNELVLVGNLDGSGSPTVLFDNPTDGVHRPQGVALDVSGGKVYWTSGNGASGNTIMVGNLNGSGSPVVLFDNASDGVFAPYGIAVDLSNSKVYWGEAPGTAQNNRIRVGNLDGSGTPTDLFDSATDGLDFPLEIALDVSNDRIYWVEGDPGTLAGRNIKVGNLNGSGSPTILFDNPTDGLAFPAGIALDVANAKLYWTDLVTNKIQVGNLDGSGSPTDLFDAADGLMQPTGLVLDLAMSAPATVASAGIVGSLSQAYDDGVGDWTITFDQPVSNMDVGDVTLTHTGTSAATGLTLQTFGKAAGSSFTFRASGVTGVGTMTLAFTPVDVTTTTGGAPVTEGMVIGTYLNVAGLGVSSLGALTCLIALVGFCVAVYFRRGGTSIAREG